MKHPMYRLLFLLCLMLMIPFRVRSQWQYPVRHFSRHVYHAGNNNWMFKQHSNGWIYAANDLGLLELDGKQWSLYPMLNAKVRALHIHSSGLIFAGGIFQFGYFQPNHLGRFDYVSLSDHFKFNVPLGVVRHIFELNGNIYYQTDRSLFVWNWKELSVVCTTKLIYTSALLYGDYYLATEKGLFKGFSLDPSAVIPGSEQLGHTVALLPLEGQVLIVTQHNGLFLYNGVRITPFFPVDVKLLSDCTVSSASIRGHLLALGSVQRGVILVHLDEKVINQINTRQGLQKKSVLGLDFDGRGNLWVGLDNGIDCILLNSPVRSFFSYPEEVGTGYASALYDDKLYLGTIQGVYVTSPPGANSTSAPVRFLSGTEGQVRSFLTYDNQLFCTSDNGIFIINSKQVQPIRELKGIRQIIPVPGRPDYLIAGAYGTQNGLHLLHKEHGSWSYVGAIRNFLTSPKSMVMESDGRTMWVTNKGQGVLRLRLSADLQEVEESKQYHSNLIPKDYESQVVMYKEHLLIASRTGLWQYVPEHDRLEPCRLWSSHINPSNAYTYFKVDKSQHVWYVSEGSMYLLPYDAMSNTYLPSVAITHLQGLLLSDYEDVTTYDKQAIVSTEDGFTLVFTDKLHQFNEIGSVQIRHINLTANKDSLIYGKSVVPNDMKIEIPYHDNSLRINFYSNDYLKAASSLYVYQLARDGEKAEWSLPSNKTFKEYTNLREGNYLFKVKLWRPDGQQMPEDTISFTVLPPWYRTWWSYAIYSCFLMLLVYLFRCYWVASRRRLIMEKELVILKQQQLFNRESKLKDEKIDSLKEKNLQAELSFKSEELIRTTLNIVRKNEMLLEIKKEVQGIQRSITEENLVSIKRKTLRLLADIDTNIEHDGDLESFQKAFDSVHSDFFQRLEAAYPELSMKEKQLCAYLRMNLVSKEIAPLLNVSLRGVEICRYRLRKKLGLNDRENLAKFLQQF